MKLVEHSFPIGVFIRSGKEAICEFYQPIKDRHIETDNLFKIGPLNFYSNLFS